MVSTLTYHALILSDPNRSPKRAGTRHPSIVPYESFATKDGFVNIAVTNQKQWENFCQALHFPEIAKIRASKPGRHDSPITANCVR
jgi:crotonobetainyl-CoA:carnitine CoA-transferase CaiB-like acyl-CoA transferase